MDKSSVTQFLTQNPDFLLEQADKLGLQVKGNKKVVHFAEVQLVASEDKVKRLENEMHTLIENARENGRLIENLFSLALDLINCNSEADFLNAISQTLINHFNLEAYAFRLSPELKQGDWLSEDFFLTAQEQDMLERIEKLTKPVCFHYLPEEMMSWLKASVPLQSFIQLPLFLNHSTKANGVFIIGSANPKRFQSEHDTAYVSKMSQAITNCMNRLRDK